MLAYVSKLGIVRYTVHIVHGVGMCVQQTHTHTLTHA